MPDLNQFILISVLVVLVVYFAWFLRKRKNRAAATHALDLDDNKR
jgi:cbb3-type cytochrome oxidase subunit 3